LDRASIHARHPAAARDSLWAGDLDFRQVTIEPDLSTVAALLAAPEQLQGQRPQDGPSRVATLREFPGLQAVMQALLDARVSVAGLTQPASQRLALQQARKQVA
jgi:hypothetical protein